MLRDVSASLTTKGHREGQRRVMILPSLNPVASLVSGSPGNQEVRIRIPQLDNLG